MTNSNKSLRICNHGHEYYKAVIALSVRHVSKHVSLQMDFSQSFQHPQEGRWSIMASQRWNNWPRSVKKRF